MAHQTSDGHNIAQNTSDINLGFDIHGDRTKNHLTKNTGISQCSQNIKAMKCLRESQNGFFVPLLNTEESMTDDERIFEIAQKTALINPQSESMVEGSSNTEMNQSIEKPEPGLKLDSSLNKLSLSRNSFVTDKKTPCLLQFNSIVVDCNDFDYDRPNLPNEQKYDCS